MPKTKKKAAPKKVAAKKVAAKKAAKPEETMDRRILKSIAGQLKGSGSDVRVLKADTDEQLHKKVDDALRKMPSDEMVKRLEAIDPDKLKTLLSRDCIGIFVDLSDVGCQRCRDVDGCVRAFLKNLKGDFADLEPATSGEAKAKLVQVKNKVKPVSRYEGKRAVFCRDRKNPNPVGDDYHDTIQRVLDEQPDTLAALREIVERDFDVGSDGEFMKFVTALRDPAEGVIKLDVDLTDADRKALIEAGYEL